MTTDKLKACDIRKYKIVYCTPALYMAGGVIRQSQVHVWHFHFFFLCFSVCGMGEWGSWEVGVEGGQFSGNPVSRADSECNREVTFLHMPRKQDCPKICALQDGRGAPELYSRS